MTEDPLHSARYSVRHAKRHIDHLDAECQAFYGSSPYARVKEFDPEGPFDLHKIKLVKAMPEALAGIAFDAVNSLRAALDHAGFAVGTAAGASGKNSHFPFGDTRKEVESRIGSGSKDIPQSVFDLMVACEPYKGGNGLLWALNKLCNSHKHEVILPMAIYAGGATISTFSGTGRNVTFPPLWDSAKNEMLLATMAHGVPMQMNIEVSTYVAIAKVEGVLGQPAVAVLKQIANQVEGIISAIDHLARSSGIFK